MQPEAISIQEKLNNALSTIFSQKIEVVGAGRTDTGVHALQMFAHFDIESDMKDDIAFKLNSILPDDIVIYEVFLVDNSTHARFDAVSRTYQYKIWLGRNPFLLDFSWQIHTLKPDVLKMNEAAKLLLEYEDFQCFSKVKTNVFLYYIVNQ